MGEPTRFDEDGIVCLGPILGATQIDYPAASIIDADVSAAAAIAASKCQRDITLVISQTGTVVTVTHLVHFCKGATGTIKRVTVSNVTACAGASTVTVDVEKNGVSILSAAQTLNSGTAAYSENIPTITTSDLADGDYLEVVITANQSGTDALATGVMCQVELDEDYEA